MTDRMESMEEAERRAVREHCGTLASEWGWEVSMEYAISDWLESHSLGWRTKRLAHMLELERQEILRHKWIESEKANRDLGREAVADWIDKHARKWRQWYEHEHKFHQA